MGGLEGRGGREFASCVLLYFLTGRQQLAARAEQVTIRGAALGILTVLPGVSAARGGRAAVQAGAGPARRRGQPGGAEESYQSYVATVHSKSFDAIN